MKFSHFPALLGVLTVASCGASLEGGAPGDTRAPFAVLSPDSGPTTPPLSDGAKGGLRALGFPSAYSDLAPCDDSVTRFEFDPYVYLADVAWWIEIDATRSQSSLPVHAEKNGRTKHVELFGRFLTDGMESASPFEPMVVMLHSSYFDAVRLVGADGGSSGVRVFAGAVPYEDIVGPPEWNGLPRATSMILWAPGELAFAGECGIAGLETRLKERFGADLVPTVEGLIGRPGVTVVGPPDVTIVPDAERLQVLAAPAGFRRVELILDVPDTWTGLDNTLCTRLSNGQWIDHCAHLSTFKEGPNTLPTLVPDAESTIEIWMMDESGRIEAPLALLGSFGPVDAVADSLRITLSGEPVEGKATVKLVVE